MAPTTSSSAAKMQQRLDELQKQLADCSSDDEGDVSSAPRADDQEKKHHLAKKSERQQKKDGKKNKNRPLQSSDDDSDYEEIENSEVDDINDKFPRGMTIKEGNDSKAQERVQMQIACSGKHSLSEDEMVHILSQTLNGVYSIPGLKSWATKAKKGSGKILPAHMNPKFNFSKDFQKVFDEVDRTVKDGDKEHYYDLLKAAINASIEKKKYKDVSPIVDPVVKRLSENA